MSAGFVITRTHTVNGVTVSSRDAVWGDIEPRAELIATVRIVFSANGGRDAMLLRDRANRGGVTNLGESIRYAVEYREVAS